jgi:hypothetical protein
VPKGGIDAASQHHVADQNQSHLSYLLSPNNTDSMLNGSIGVAPMALKAIGLAGDDLIGEKESGAAVLEYAAVSRIG